MNEQEKIKKWYETWQKAGPALDAIRVRELQDKHYYDKRIDLLHDMLDYAVDHGTNRTTSGFVEQQKLFRKYFVLIQEQTK